MAKKRKVKRPARQAPPAFGQWVKTLTPAEQSCVAILSRAGALPSLGAEFLARVDAYNAETALRPIGAGLTTEARERMADEIACLESASPAETGAMFLREAEQFFLTVVPRRFWRPGSLGMLRAWRQAAELEATAERRA